MLKNQATEVQITLRAGKSCAMVGVGLILEVGG
jgi:hypothetical protein